MNLLKPAYHVVLVALVVTTPLRAEDPSFPEEPRLVGTTLYALEDWSLITGGPITVFMDVHGLYVSVHGPSGARVSAQHRAAILPSADRMIRARFRVWIEHWADNDSRIGLFNQTSDPFGQDDPPGDPENGAFFSVERAVACYAPGADCDDPNQRPEHCTSQECHGGKTMQRILWETRTSTEQTLDHEGELCRFYEERQNFDLEITFDGIESVTFCCSDPEDPSPTCVTRTEDLPAADGAYPPLLSAAIRQQTANVGSLSFQVIEVEIEKKPE
jgi:hypothetical protein